MPDNTIKVVKPYFHLQLDPLYPPEEVGNFAHLVIEHLFDIDRAGLIANPDFRMTESEMIRVVHIVKRLKKFEPIQYILGHTEFYGLRMTTTDAALIPRPETEELVRLIIKDHRPTDALDIMDIGTGSGCIALALKQHLAAARVSGIDESDVALELAKQNAHDLELDVRFSKGDILNWEDWPAQSSLDIVVSNPPYVLEKEKDSMRPNVLDHEPWMALFVKDEDPLLFYRRITEMAASRLVPGGKLYFEINEAYAQQTTDLLVKLGFQAVQVFKDLNGKDRMIRASYKT